MAPRITVDQAPDPDGGRDLKSAFDVLIERLPALEEAILQQTTMMQQQLDVQTRMQWQGGGRQEAVGHVAGAMAQYQPQMRQDVLRGLTRTGGIPADMTMGITKMTGTRALTSLQNLHAYGAQRLGQMIAGADYPLYEQQKQAGQSAAVPSEDLRPKPVGRHRTTTGMAGDIAGGAAEQGGQAPDVLAATGVAQQAAGPLSWKLTAKGVKEGIEEAEAETGGLGGLVAGTAAAATASAEPGRPHVDFPSDLVGKMPAPSGVQPPPGAAGGGTHGGPGGGPGGGGLGAAGGAGGGGAPPGGGAAAGAAGGTGGGVTGSQAASLRQNLGARVAMSGGTPGGILGMLSKVPVLGLGIDLLNKGAEVYQQQREAGRVYQETEGGTNLQAQAERGHAFAYEASMFGRVPEGVAAQMFGDVTSMGYSRQAVGQAQQLQNRQSALNFMYHQYTATGTSPDQSAAILATASQNATISLKNVSDAMTELSDTAGKAGTNAVVARNNFNALLNTAIQGGAAGGAPVLAGGQATTQASYGNAFQGTSFAGMNAPTEQYMLAGQTGMTPAQIQYEQRTNPKGYNTLVAGSQMQFITNGPGMTPQLMASLQQMIQAAGGAAQIKQQPALAQQIATQFLNQYQTSDSGLDSNVWASYLSSVSGIKLTPGNVWQWVVEQVAGNNVASNTASGAGTGSAPGKGSSGTATTPGSTVSAGQAATGGASGAATGQYGLATASQSLAGRQVINKSWQQVLQGSSGGSAAASQYLGQEKKTGQRNPVLEALMQNVPSGTQVAVKTASGTRVMSFAQAMQFYPDEMEQGDVQFYSSSGQNLGSTANITQGLVDPSANVNAEQAGKAGSNVGVSLSQFQKSKGISAGGGQTVDLTPDAKKLLKLLPSNSDNAAAQGAPPANPLPASSSR